MHARPVIDVTHLPTTELDHRSSIWWGNLLLLAIETTMFALLVGGYFYLRTNFHEWPPPYIHGPYVLVNSAPRLLVPGLNLALLLLSCAPMFWADRAAWHMKTRQVVIALSICLGLGLLLIVVRFREFSAFYFRWDDNAYGSIVWTIMGMHLLHLIVGTAENVIMLAWLVRHGMDRKHARDVRVTAVYWYWIAAIWVPLWVILFIGPRMM
jgi:heme/copper-type cytochrome/quinol oxidase subunit 3